MQKIQIVKDYSTTRGEFYKRGETIEVSNNIAFGLIDKGVAKIFKASKNKMMTAEKTENYNKNMHYRIK